MDKPNTNCIVCSNRAGFDIVSDRLRDSENHSVVRCLECGMMQIHPLPTAEDDKHFYNENRQAKNIGKRTDVDYLRKTESADTKRRVDFVSNKFSGKTSVLDIGSGHGFFLDEMSRLGFQASGVEVSEERREISGKVTTAPVFDNNLLEDAPDLGKFDVITMFHVVEHLTDPIGICRIAGKYLAENGALVVEVPNSKDLMLQACSPYLSFWWQRAHLGYFDTGLLRRVLEAAGYLDVEIIGLQRFGLDNMMNWLVNGMPQIDSPSFETTGPHQWLEQSYKSHLEATLDCDTLLAVARN